MIEVYPSLKVYCPKTELEEDGNECLTCEYFRGISINDFELATANKSQLFFRCFYKKEVEEKENV